MVLGEFDPEGEIVEPGVLFTDLWKETFGAAKGMELKWIRSHNHISPPLSLISGDEEGEEWGEDVVRWMRSKMGRTSRPKDRSIK